jgi:hypothetical protein
MTLTELGRGHPYRFGEVKSCIRISWLYSYQG